MEPAAVTQGGSATAAARSAGIMVDGGITSGVAREVVSASDIIRAIKTSDIAIRYGEAPAAAAGQVWLFDEAQGAFVAPDPEPLTIRLERHGRDTADTVDGVHGRRGGPVLTADAMTADAMTADAMTDTLALAVAAPIIAAESSWFGTLRQFGRKAARVVQQGTRWMS
jgi:hypothetical protein